MTEKEIIEELFAKQDLKYKQLLEKILPTLPGDTIIGVRTPELKKMAKAMAKMEGIGSFLSDLPHKYFDENQLHAFIISEIKSYDDCIKEVEKFLPHVDNWATCDQMSPKIFKKNREKLLEHIKIWIERSEPYTIRFGVGMLMEHFLDEDFDTVYPKMVARLRSDEYYVNMMIAWYFATALAKQYEKILPFIEDRRLDTWTHNKAIQKSVESYRITPDQKEYLKKLKIKKGEEL